MCALCRTIKKHLKKSALNENETRDYFEQISKAIEQGAKPEHFQEALDLILGTDMPDVDAELEAAWENERRGNG